MFNIHGRCSICDLLPAGSCAYKIGGRIRNAIAFVIAFVVAVIVYAITLLLFKGLSEDEIRKFPKGMTIIRFAKKFHLL